MYELKIVSHFAAAHQLKMVADKCENLHGHNWRIEVFVEGEHLNSVGILMDFGELKKHVRDTMKLLDHKFLNETHPFGADHPPSSENIAHFVAKEVQHRIDDPSIRITRVSAWESENACATYVAD